MLINDNLAGALRPCPLQDWAGGSADNSRASRLGSGDGSELLGKASARRKVFQSKFFFEPGVSDLVRSMPFQKKAADSGSDSKDRQRFQRFAVMVHVPTSTPIVSLTSRTNGMRSGLNYSEKSRTPKLCLIGTPSFRFVAQ